MVLGNSTDQLPDHNRLLPGVWRQSPDSIATFTSCQLYELLGQHRPNGGRGDDLQPPSPCRNYDAAALSTKPHRGRGGHCSTYLWNESPIIVHTCSAWIDSILSNILFIACRYSSVWKFALNAFTFTSFFKSCDRKYTSEVQ